EAFKVLTGAAAVEKLVLFDIGQTIAEPVIDHGAKAGSIRQDLDRGAHPVGNRANVRDRLFKLDFRLRLQGTFLNRCGKVGKSLLLVVLDGVGRRIALSQKSTDSHSTARELDWSGPIRANQRAYRAGSIRGE